jgi:MHS family proline/betaine transporter-like MFS transporter
LENASRTGPSSSERPDLPDDVLLAALPETRSAAMRWRAIASCSVGNFLELFDFSVFGFFAATIGRNFFPGTDASLSLLSSFAMYGVGFMMRPVGAMILGVYGDRHGRKRLLVLTIGLMAVATGAMALIPPYADIGIWAPILLLLCRLLQGFSTGGEWGGAATFLVEYAEPGRRGFIGSLQQVGFGLGMIGGTLSAALVNGLMTAPSVESWGWRIPFLVGCLLGPVGAYIRATVSETPAFQRSAAAHRLAAAPVLEAFTTYLRPMLIVLGIGVVGTAGGYISNVFLPPFAIRQLGLNPHTVYTTTVIAAIIQTVFMPVFGAWSDRVGRKTVLLVSAGGYLVTIYPLFLLLTGAPGLGTLMLTQGVAALFVAMNSGPMAAVFCELFPTRVRLTALSIGFSLAVAIFGGFAPFVATALVRETGSLLSPTYYGIFCAVITVTALLAMRDPTNATFEDAA